MLLGNFLFSAFLLHFKKRRQLIRDREDFRFSDQFYWLVSQPGELSLSELELVLATILESMIVVMSKTVTLFVIINKQWHQPFVETFAFRLFPSLVSHIVEIVVRWLRRAHAWRKVFLFVCFVVFEYDMNAEGDFHNNIKMLLFWLQFLCSLAWKLKAAFATMLECMTNWLHAFVWF